MPENLLTVFLINSVISSKHQLAQEVIMGRSKGFRLGKGQPKNATVVFRSLSIGQITGEKSQKLWLV